jgi:hypothetical protein
MEGLRVAGEAARADHGIQYSQFLELNEWGGVWENVTEVDQWGRFVL